MSLSPSSMSSLLWSSSLPILRPASLSPCLRPTCNGPRVPPRRSPSFHPPLHSLIGLLSFPRAHMSIAFPRLLLPSFLLGPSSSPSLPPVRQFGHGFLNIPFGTLCFLPVLTFFLSPLIHLLSLPVPPCFPSTPVQVPSHHAPPSSPGNV